MDDGSETDKEGGMARGTIQSRMYHGSREVVPCPVAESE